MPTTIFTTARDKTVAQQGPPAYTGASQHTSAQAIPIPLLWGTRRIAPNLIWMGGMPPSQTGSGNAHLDGPDALGHGWDKGGAFELTLQGNAFLGRVLIDSGSLVGFQYGIDDPGNADSIWWRPAMFCLCEGPVNSISKIWSGGDDPGIRLDWTPGVVGAAWGSWQMTVKTPSLFYTLFPGDGSQTAWGYFAAVDAAAVAASVPPPFVSQNLAYRRTAYIASAVVDFGHDNSPPQQAFEVVRTPDTTARKLDSASLGYDYAPDAFIVDFLTSAQYGMGLSGSDIDSASLTAYQQYTRAQGIYLSPLLDAQTAATDIIDRWALLTNTWIFFDGSTIGAVRLGDES